MSLSYFELRDVQRDAVRAACAAVEDALAHLSDTTTGPSAAETELRARWDKLVALLALEPARVLRACPVCHHLNMFEASRCGHCWAKLSPPTARDAITAGPVEVS